MSIVDEYPEFPTELLRQPNKSVQAMKADVDAGVGEDAPVTSRVRANGVGKPAKAAPKPAKAAPKAAKQAKATAAPKAQAAPKPAKAAKPPRASKVERDKYGLKVGSLRSKAAALYASKKGATLAEVAEKLGSSTQYNVLVALEKRGFKVEKFPESGKGRKSVMRFKLT